MSLSVFVTLFLAIFATAVPLGDFAQFSERHCETCSTSNAKLILPSGQTNLTATSGDASFVMLGVGYQNYTCGAAGTYT